MAFSINRVTLLGNISQDPQLTYSPKGTAILKLNLATNYSRKNDTTGEWEDQPSFHRITVFGKTAEYMGQGNLNKGDKCYIDGRIEYGSYEKDGVTRYTTDIIAYNIIPMTGSGSAQANATAQSQASSPPAQQETASASPKKSKAEEKSAPETSKKTDKPQEKVSVDDIPF